MYPSWLWRSAPFRLRCTWFVVTLLSQWVCSQCYTIIGISHLQNNISRSISITTVVTILLHHNPSLPFSLSLSLFLLPPSPPNPSSRSSSSLHSPPPQHKRYCTRGIFTSRQPWSPNKDQLRATSTRWPCLQRGCRQAPCFSCTGGVQNHYVSMGHQTNSAFVI